MIMTGWEPASIFGKTAYSGRRIGRDSRRGVRNLPGARINEPFVIGAIIDLGLCLDLLEAESIAIVADGWNGLRQSYDVAGVPALENRRIAGESVICRLDCAVINYVHLLREQEGEPAFDSVRAPFIEGPTATKPSDCAIGPG
jgi:hypothetical protein